MSNKINEGNSTPHDVRLARAMPITVIQNVVSYFLSAENIENSIFLVHKISEIRYFLRYKVSSFFALMKIF